MRSKKKKSIIKAETSNILFHIVSIIRILLDNANDEDEKALFDDCPKLERLLGVILDSFPFHGHENYKLNNEIVKCIE